MCGIVGYIGEKKAAPILLDGLSKLEYRGYDSAGIATIENGELSIEKCKGRLQNLCDKIQNGEALQGKIGIGHTRWATHGAPSDLNSHPHKCSQSLFTVVHNGIIENYLPLKEELTVHKHVPFVSETDTEVIAHLLSYYYNGNVLETIQRVINAVEGSFALGILCRDTPNTLYAVKKDSPLIVGKGNGENFIASDIPALLNYTKDFYLVDDGDIVMLKKDSLFFFDRKLHPLKKEPFVVDWDYSQAEKGGYAHFMLKEIHEQQKAVNDTVSERIGEEDIVFEDFHYGEDELKALHSIRIVACGSAYHVGVIGKYVIEKLARIPVEVDVASEFRYKNPILQKDVMYIMISQSGETADSLAAMREIRKQGYKVLAVVNVLGSSIAREADSVIYTHAGPEIAVATTKAFSAQLAVMDMLALKIAHVKETITKDAYKEALMTLRNIPARIETVVSNADKVKKLASRLKNVGSVFFIGRDIDYAVCLEGSLKLKEISYIHSEAYAAGELKHGTISLIEEGVVVVAIVTQPHVREKVISNIKEVKTRVAFVFAVANEGDEEIRDIVDFVYYIPKTNPVYTPSLSVLPLQVFAYCVAKEKGCDIDKPRNLAKSVTVE